MESLLTVVPVLLALFAGVWLGRWLGRRWVKQWLSRGDAERTASLEGFGPFVSVAPDLLRHRCDIHTTVLFEPGEQCPICTAIEDKR